MLVGRVEDSTIDEASLIFHLYLVAGLGNGTIALLQHLILQTAGQRNDAFLLGIILQEVRASLLQLLLLALRIAETRPFRNFSACGVLKSVVSPRSASNRP